MDTIDKIKMLVATHTNDMDLGREVRKLLSEIKQTQKERIIEMGNWHGDADEDY